MLVWKSAGQDNYHSIGHARLNLIIVCGQCAVYGHSTKMFDPVGRRTRSEDLAPSEVFERIYRKVCHQVICFHSTRAEKDNVLGLPRFLQCRKLAVKFIHNLERPNQIIRYERREVSDVLQRHLRSLPKRADPTCVGQAIAHSLQSVFEAIKRATVGFGPFNPILRPHRLQTGIGFSHHKRGKLTNPRKHCGVAGRHC